jgi:hypothetical protein
MARDPLQILQAVRRRAIEQARYALAACLTAEAAVADKVRSIDDAVRRDRAASAAWPDARQFLEMSALRLETVRTECRTVATDFAAAASRSAEARGIVTAARTAAEAVEQLIGERQAASRIEAAKREQHMLDDIARARLTVRQGNEPR